MNWVHEDMSDADLRRLDMGLLLVFSETMRLRRVTAVAQRLGQTQSAVSHALARLRDIFGDPLFLRRPYGVEPTARAVELEPTVERLLDLARSAVAPPSRFDPARAQGSVRIAAQDYHCGLFAAPLVARCEREAPGLRPAFLPLARREALTALEEGAADLAVGYLAAPGDRFVREPLFEQGYALVARRDHPRLAALGTLEAYAAERHLLVSQTGDHRGVVDEALEARGLRRAVVASLPYYLAALEAVAATDLVATVPRALAERWAERFALALLEPPLPIRRFAVAAVRHRRNRGGAVLDWVVAALREAAPVEAA